MSWLEIVKEWDSQFLVSINGLNSPSLDYVMWMISSPYFGIPFYVFFLIVLLKTKNYKEVIVCFVLLLVVVGLADLTAKYCFKEFFQRYRPTHNINLKEQLHIVNNYRGGKYGFISSHACNMFALSFLFYQFIKIKYRWSIWFLFSWALIIGYSRVYLGVHYPSDVLVGGMVGIVIAQILYYLSLEFNWVKC
jgi:undecaprenyl-diphosphatase